MSDQPSITAAELARRVDGELEGDGTRVLHGVATLDQADADTISWVASVDFLVKIVKSSAGLILVPRDCEVPPGRTVVRVADPDVAVCKALECLAPPIETVERGVHPSAVVSPEAIVEGSAIGAGVYVGPGAVVGKDTQLFPGVFVGSGTRIGCDCAVWPNAVIRERVTIGDRVVIHPNVTIGADGFGYLQRDGKHRKIPQIGTVVIEDDVEIGAGCTIDRARSGTTRIRRGTKIDNLVQIGHNVDVGEDCIIVAQSCIGGSSSLGNHVVMSGQVGISDHVHIGNGVQIAGKSTVLRDIPDGKVIRGIPATDHHRFLREQASLRKLPEWIKRIRALTRRVEQIEERS